MSKHSSPIESTLPASPDYIRDLVRRAESGDASTLPALRHALQDLAIVEALGGNLAMQAEQSLIGKLSGKNLAVAESIRRKMELLRGELGGPDPIPVERLLIERVVACWLQVQEADLRYGQSQSLTAQWTEVYQRRMNHANRRYLAALKTLAVVRKLAVPALQVNIAHKQNNFAGNPTPLESD